MKKNKSFKIEPYLYILPAMILFVLFTFYPFVKTFILSFFRVTSGGDVKEFVGVTNYINILNNIDFISAVKNSFKFALIVTPIELLIGLGLSLLANKKNKLSFVYELFFAITMAISSSVAAMIFKLLYNPTIGILNYWFNTSLQWLNDPKIALLSLAIIWIWINIGYNFIFMLSALRGIPKELLESADIDGANFIRRTTKIIIPMISPTIFYLFITQVAGNLMMSALTLILTDGGPQGTTETMLSFMIKQSVNNQNYNAGYAASILVFVITAIVMLISMKAEKRGVHYN